MPAAYGFDEGGRYGKIMRLWTPMTEQIFDLIRTENITGLSLIEATGWSDDSIEFLREIPGILWLELGTSKVKDDSPIYALTKLRALGIGTACEAQFDLSRLVELESFFLEWHPRYQSCLTHAGLKQLKVFNSPWKDFSQFNDLVGLHDLDLPLGKFESLTGAPDMTQLRRLRVAAVKKLNSIEGIQVYRNLEDFEISGAGPTVISTEPLAHLVHLRKLMLDVRNVDTLKHLEQLEKLEILSLTFASTRGPTVIDGDLSVLTRLPSLSAVNLPNRSHYSLKSSYFEVMNERHREEALNRRSPFR